MTRVSPSEQPSGCDSIAGGPPWPSGFPGFSMSGSYCTRWGKSAAVSIVALSVAPGHVAVPAIVLAQPVTPASRRTATADNLARRRIMGQGYPRGALTIVGLRG